MLASDIPTAIAAPFLDVGPAPQDTALSFERVKDILLTSRVALSDAPFPSEARDDQRSMASKTLAEHSTRYPANSDPSVLSENLTFLNMYVFRLYQNAHKRDNTLHAILHTARALDLPFAAYLIDSKVHNDSLPFGYIALLIFADGNFCLFCNGEIIYAEHSQEKDFFPENGPVALKDDVQSQRLRLLCAHREEDLSFVTREGETGDISDLSSLLNAWEESNDPYFDPSENGMEFDLDASSVQETALLLLAGIGGHDASISFDIASQESDQGVGGVGDISQCENINHALYAELLELLHPELAHVSGEIWNYNDGHINRKSGYTVSHTATYISLSLQHYTNHEVLAKKAEFFELLDTHPALKEIKEDILERMDARDEE